jgi:hypothetical protein
MKFGPVWPALLASAISTIAFAREPVTREPQT